MDHNDLYVLDLTPSLKTLAMMVVNRHGLSTEVLSILLTESSSLHLWLESFEIFAAIIPCSLFVSGSTPHPAQGDLFHVNQVKPDE